MDYKYKRPVPELDSRTLALYKLLANDIYQYFVSQDDPPADEIYVPVEIFKKVNDTTYDATVRFIVDCCGRKVHNVRIRFNIDNKFRFISSTWRYL